MGSKTKSGGGFEGGAREQGRELGRGGSGDYNY